MTLGALKTHAQKHLTGGFGEILRAACHPVVVAGSARKGAALSEDQVVHKLIYRSIASQLLVYPVGKAPHAFYTESWPVAAQQIAPLQRPEVRILASAQHRVSTEPVARLSGWLSERKASISSLGWSRSNEIKAYASNKGSIITNGRWF